jgi:uncharacterized protein YbjQ (UPF0145 family)
MLHITIKNLSFFGVVVALVVAGAIVGIASAGVAHPNIMPAIKSQIEPLAQARHQSITIVRSAKRDLGAEGINELDLKYAALQTKANDYLGTVVEAINVGSLDKQRSRQKAIELKKAIDGFVGSLQPLLVSPAHVPSSTPKRIALPLSDKWVDALQRRLDAVWPRYGQQLAAMPIATRAAIAEQVKRAFAWPEFQDIR